MQKTLLAATLATLLAGCAQMNQVQWSGPEHSGRYVQFRDGAGVVLFQVDRFDDQGCRILAQTMKDSLAPNALNRLDCSNESTSDLLPYMLTMKGGDNVIAVEYRELDMCEQEVAKSDKRTVFLQRCVKR
jgi:hypothetical protein